MINKLKRIQRIIKIGILFSKNGYLMETGWWNSFKSKLPTDRFNQPIPWVTYGFIDFISDRLNKNLTIFEFGSGNSTFFYAQRVKKITALEHDEIWYNQIIDKTPKNAEVLFELLEYGGKYSKKIATNSEKYDIVIIDGRDRVNCMLNSIDNLSERGVLVLDDAERPAYIGGINEVMRKGFRKLDFWGLAPGVTYRKCTTIFYKENNCLNL